MNNSDKIKPWSPSQEKFGKRLIKSIGKWQTRVYEFSGGRLWNTFLGCPCAILTTTGAQSGLPRKTPLLFIQEDDKVIMAASSGGFSKHPYWYNNLKVNREVEIQIGNKKQRMIAQEASDDEALELWPKLDAMYDGYSEYRARTKAIRKIPVIIFSPTA